MLVTARLRLRAFTPGDLRSLLAYRRDPDVARYQYWPANYTEAEGSAFISEVSSAVLGSCTWVNVAAELKTTGELIGDVALRVEPDRTAGEIGVTFASHRQGCGYAREAVAALCTFAFEDAKLPRLFARRHPQYACRTPAPSVGLSRLRRLTPCHVQGRAVRRALLRALLARAPWLTWAFISTRPREVRKLISGSVAALHPILGGPGRRTPESARTVGHRTRPSSELRSSVVRPRR